MKDDVIRIVRARHGEENPYFMSARDSAQDSQLSFDARGVLWYLLSKSDNWVLRTGDLQREGDIGRDKCSRIINELIEAGYVVKTQVREQGKFSHNEYAIYESPLTEKPLTVKPATANPPLKEYRGLQSTEKTTPPSGEGFTEEYLRNVYNPSMLTENQAIVLARCYVNEEYALIKSHGMELSGLIEYPYRKSNKARLTDIGVALVEVFYDKFKHKIDEALAYNANRDATMKKNRAAEREKKTRPPVKKGKYENIDTEPMRKAIVAAFGWQEKDVTSWPMVDKVAHKLRKAGATPDDLPHWAVWNTDRKFGTVSSLNGMLTSWMQYKKELRESVADDDPYVEPTIDIGEKYL